MSEWLCDMCYPDRIEIFIAWPGVSFVYDPTDKTYYLLGGQGHRGDEILTWGTNKPTIDVFFDLEWNAPNEEWDKIEADYPLLIQAFENAADGIEWNIKHPMESWSFVNECINHLGYDPAVHGTNLDYFLTHKIAERLRTLG